MIVMESIKRNPRVAGLLAGVVLACLPHLAQAGIFMCKDASGRTITSDRPIPECANRAVKELNVSGTVKREIPAPLTVEQRQLKKEAEDKRKADEEVTAEIRRRDVGLLATYQNEQQIDTERKRALTQLRNNISIAVTEQNAALVRRKVAQAEITALTENKAPVPSHLKAKLMQADKSILFETRTKESLEAEMVKIGLKYDQIMTRYRLVVANGPGFDAATAVASAASAASSASKP